MSSVKLPKLAPIATLIPANTDAWDAILQDQHHALVREMNHALYEMDLIRRTWDRPIGGNDDRDHVGAANLMVQYAQRLQDLTVRLDALATIQRDSLDFEVTLFMPS